MTPPVIEARGLTKRYGDVSAVDDVSLRIEAGEIYALLGLNGAGKTTTIRMLLGMVRPTGGSVAVLGTALRPGTKAVWSRVGYLVETPAAYPELTVIENLAVAARLRGLRGGHHVSDVIDRLGLDPYAHRRARTLSLGNAQRLGLAKALLHKPDLLILDEPANGLDPAGVAEIRDLLLDLSLMHGVTVLLSSHILTEVARLATRIGVIQFGSPIDPWIGASAAVESKNCRHLSVVRPPCYDTLPLTVEQVSPAAGDPVRFLDVIEHLPTARALRLRVRGCTEVTVTAAVTAPFTVLSASVTSPHPNGFEATDLLIWVLCTPGTAGSADSGTLTGWQN
ncbi:ABC-type multidrug transport system ATPase subunit [Lentzea atacamensis]|uniref:ABC-type multidrug transport system ATPase subunit n=1 Tax=Lentzea atacamensis TaxID=531938 RepID=A0A316HSY4_9PSEU|nr:ABC transporter ATP-binding protein [Lentzea atacamensis]PWK84464.1 ABC-type multidrug transport system ATPase subunit [Lentzea atacamensis]